jgi:5'-nucleotidase
MARPMGHIRILLSSRVLLDLEEADKIYMAKGPQAYTDYLRCRGDYADGFDKEIGGRRLGKGSLWNFAAACLKLNEGLKEPVVEIGMACKDEQESGLVIFRNLDVNGLAEIGYRRATAGKALTMQDHEAFGSDVYFTRNAADAQFAVDNGIAAAQMHLPAGGTNYTRSDGKPVQLWVDGDAVAFGSSSEVIYRTQGLEIYRELEKKNFQSAIEAGPFTQILAKISQLNERFPRGEQPFEIALVTARGGDAGAHALAIAEHHGFKFNGGMYFMSGAAKVAPLKAHKPDIFLDDQLVHLKEACQHVPTGLVAYPKGSPMHEYVAQQKAKEDADRRAAKEQQLKDTARQATEPAQAAAKPRRKRGGPAPA